MNSNEIKDNLKNPFLDPLLFLSPFLSHQRALPFLIFTHILPVSTLASNSWAIFHFKALECLE